MISQLYNVLLYCHNIVVVTMYFGVEEPRAAMPPWAKWVVLGFGAWRLLADILLTLVNFFSGSHVICFILRLIDSMLVLSHLQMQ